MIKTTIIVIAFTSILNLTAQAETTVEDTFLYGDGELSESVDGVDVDEIMSEIERLNSLLPMADSGSNYISLSREKIGNELIYVVILGSLCICTLALTLYFMKDRTHTAKDIVNLTGLTLIIFGTIILVLVVSTSEQLTAAIGILGAIAGYLFRSVQEGPEPIVVEGNGSSLNRDEGT